MADDSGDEIDDCLTQLLDESKNDDNMLMEMAAARKNQIKERINVRTKFNGHDLGSQILTDSDRQVKQLDFENIDKLRETAMCEKLQQKVAHLTSQLTNLKNQQMRTTRMLEKERMEHAQTVDSMREGQKRMEMDFEKEKESLRSCAAFKLMNNRFHADKSFVQPPQPSPSYKTCNRQNGPSAETNGNLRRSSSQAGLDPFPDIPAKAGEIQIQSSNISKPYVSFPNMQTFYGSGSKKQKLMDPNKEQSLDFPDRQSLVSDSVRHEMLDESVQTSLGDKLCDGNIRRWALTDKLIKGRNIIEISSLSLYENIQPETVNSAMQAPEPFDASHTEQRLEPGKRLSANVASPSSFLTPTSCSPFRPQVCSTAIKDRFCRKMPSDILTDKLSRWLIVLRDYRECLDKLTEYGIALTLQSQEDSPPRCRATWNHPRSSEKEETVKSEESMLIDAAQGRGRLALCSLTDLVALVNVMADSCDVLFGVEEDESLESFCSQVSGSLSLELQEYSQATAVPAFRRSDSRLSGDPNIQQSKSMSLSVDEHRESSVLAKPESELLLDILFDLIRADAEDEALLIDHVTEHSWIIEKVFELLNFFVKSCSREPLVRRLQNEFNAPSQMHSHLARLLSRSTSSSIWLPVLCHFFGRLNTFYVGGVYTWLCNNSAHCCLAALITRVHKLMLDSTREDLFHPTVLLDLMSLLSKAAPITPEEADARNNVFDSATSYCVCTKLAVTFITHFLLSIFPPRSSSHPVLSRSTFKLTLASLACLRHVTETLNHIELRHAALEPERCDGPTILNLHGVLWRAHEAVLGYMGHLEKSCNRYSQIYTNDEWLLKVDNLAVDIEFIRSTLRLHSCY